MNKLLGSAVCGFGLLFLASAIDAAEHEALDRDFLIRAATCGNAEVKYSELAETRAGSDKVKEFARKMVKDHSRCNGRLSEYARNQKIVVVAGLEKDKRENYDRLSPLKGDEFDRAYLRQMVDDHQKAVSLFEAQVRKGTDPDLKKFAELTLPDLRDHLKQAKDLANSLK